MSKFTTEMVLNLGGNLARKARSYEDAMRRFGRNGNRSMRLLSGGTRAAGRAMDRMGNRYVALLSGAGLGLAAKGVVSLSARYTRLGVQANISAGKVDELRDKLDNVARQRTIRLDPEDILAGVEKIVEKTGDIEFATNNLEAMALAMRAASAEGVHMGAFMADLKEKFKISDTEMLAVLDGIVAQGKAGAFTLQNMAAQAERLTAAYGATGRTGAVAVRELGAVMQVIRKGTGSSEMAATAFEALLRTLTDADKVKAIGPELIFENGVDGTLRNVLDIMKDLITLTQGDTVKLSTVFDAEAIRALNSSITEFKNTGALESFDKFLNIKGDGSQILKDSARNANEAAAALEVLWATGKRIADQNLSGPIQDLADALDGLSPEQLDDYANAAKNAALAVGGVVLAYKALKGGAAIFRGVQALRRGKGGVGSALGSAAGGAGQPVFVTNWPPAGMGPGVGPGGNPRKNKRRPGGFKPGGKGRFRMPNLKNLPGVPNANRLGPIKSLIKGPGALLRKVPYLGTLLRKVPYLGTLLAGGMLMSSLTDSEASGRDKLEDSGSIVGGMGGMAAGAATGAAIGSIIPGLGTAIGGLIGGALGAWGGDVAGFEIASLLGDLIGVTRENAAKQSETRIRVEAAPGTTVRDISGSGMVDAYAGPIQLGG